MSYKTITLNSFAPVSTPTIVNGEFIDGYVGGQPVQLRKMRGGMIMPAIGTTVALPYGTGQVVGYVDESLKVAITDFNDDYEFITADEMNIYDAEETVAKYNRCFRLSVASMRSDFERIYKSDVTGVLSKTKQALMDANFPIPEDNEVVVSFKGDYLMPTDSIVVKELPKQEKETAKARRVRRALEVAEAKRLADALMDAYDAYDADCPDDIADDIADAFGDTDFNDGEMGEF